MKQQQLCLWLWRNLPAATASSAALVGDCVSPHSSPLCWAEGATGAPLLSTAPRDFEHINSSCDVLSEFCLVCVSVSPCVSPSGVMIQGLLCSWQSDTEPLLPVAVVGAPWVLSCSVLSPARGTLALIPVLRSFPHPQPHWPPPMQRCWWCY